MGRLRKETKENHKQMEALPFFNALIAGTLPVECYVGQLKTMAIIHSVLERELETSMNTAVVKVNNQRLAKLPLLSQDLLYFSHLNFSDFKTATCNALEFSQKIKLAHALNPLSLLGYLYVMEGSTLGNAGHRFDVAKTFSLKNDAGLAYYSSYKERLTENWNQFATVMDENVTDTGDQDRVIAVARDAFDGLKEIYQQLYPSIDKEMVQHVTSLNPEAGEHPIPTDPREAAAALLAGEKCWQEFPYYESRYSSRGENYTRSDSAWLAALVELEQEQVHEQICWLGRVLCQRGMPQLMLERHLAILSEALERAVPERKHLYSKLLAASKKLEKNRILFIPDQMQRELSTEFEEKVKSAGGTLPRRTGELLVAAVADELSGIGGAVASIEDWLTDASRFSAQEIETVRTLIAKARAHAAKKA